MESIKFKLSSEEYKRIKDVSYLKEIPISKILRTIFYSYNFGEFGLEKNNDSGKDLRKDNPITLGFLEFSYGDEFKSIAGEIPSSFLFAMIDKIEKTELNLIKG